MNRIKLYCTRCETDRVFIRVGEFKNGREYTVLYECPDCKEKYKFSPRDVLQADMEFEGSGEIHGRTFS